MGKVKLSDVLVYEQPTKYIVKSDDYSDSFKTPVLTAGKTFILGYTKEDEGICNAQQNPVIIFDDFTSESKFVTFDFKVKSSAMKIIRTRKPEDSLKYFYYAMQSLEYTPDSHKRVWISEYSKLEVPYPNCDMQREIVNRLEKVEALIAAKTSEMNALDELVKSRFMEMFGDPVHNPFGWADKPLLEMGYCKNGLNFHSDDSGVELHCLGVGDFKDQYVLDGTEKLSTVSLSVIPPKESLLEDGDIVFVRSNGNKALVGRCLLVFPHNTPTAYSGFCIRYRLTSNEINPFFLLYVLKADSIRETIRGRGASIQNLNQKILSTVRIPLPPIELQNEYATLVNQIDKSKLVIKKTIAELEELKSSFMQKYFFD